MVDFIRMGLLELCGSRVEREQANSENCGPPLGNKFDLEVGQRSRSRYGTIGKVLSLRTHMPSIKVLPVIVQKLWPRLKFLWQTEGQTDEWDLMSPALAPNGRHFVGFFKANINSYILLQMAAIFFLSSLYLKQGIDSVCVMVGFICRG